MLVHRMVKKVKNSKMLAKINMKDSDVDWKGMLVKDDGPDYYTAITTLARIANNPRAGKYELMNQLLPIMQANKVDFDKGKFEQAWREFSKAGMSKGIFDADHRGYKVTDQIIKGFLIYKSGKGPAMFFAKNENGKQYEGTLEQVKKQIDDYWVKQDEDVMKQKVRDTGYVVTTIGKYKIIEGIGPDGGYWFASAPGDVKRFKTRREAEEYADQSQPFRDSKTKDEDKHQCCGQTTQIVSEKERYCPKCKAAWRKVEGGYWAKNAGVKDSRPKHPRWRIKDDKLFRLRSAVKDIRKKMKDGAYEYMPIDERIAYIKKQIQSYKEQGLYNSMETMERALVKAEAEKSGQIAKPCSKCGAKNINLKGNKCRSCGGRITDSYTKGSADRKTKDVRYPNTEEAQQYQRLIGVKQFDPQEREALEKYYGKKIPITQVHNYRMHLFENKIFKDSSKGSADRKTKDDDKSDELKMMMQQMGKVEGIRAFAKKYPEYVPQFASYFKKKVEEHKTKDENLSLSEAIQQAKKELYPDRDYSTLNSTEHDNVTIRARELMNKSKSKDKLTGDPLTKKGNKILAKMRERYGKKKGESVFYASKNKGTIAGVDGKAKDGEYNVLKGKLDKIKREIERYEKAGQENSPEYKDLKKQEAKLGYDLMAYINRPKDSKSKDQAPDLKSKIVAFFKANPNPDDSTIHAFAEKEGIDPDEMETEIYKLVTEHVGMTNKDASPSDIEWRKKQYYNLQNQGFLRGVSLEDYLADFEGITAQSKSDLSAYMKKRGISADRKTKTKDDDSAMLKDVKEFLAKGMATQQIINRMMERWPIKNVATVNKLIEAAKSSTTDRKTKDQESFLTYKINILNELERLGVASDVVDRINSLKTDLMRFYYQSKTPATEVAKKLADKYKGWQWDSEKV